MTDEQNAGNADGTAMGGEETRRAAVRRLLWERLAEAGMERPARRTAESFAEMKASITQRLLHASDEDLARIAEHIMRLGGGPRRSRMPDEVTILNEALKLAPMPPLQDPLVISWMWSQDGAASREGGFHVELLRRLARYGAVPAPSRIREYKRLRSDAAENRRTLARMRKLEADGAASSQDLAWMRAYLADEKKALELIAEGDARRAAKGEAA